MSSVYFILGFLTKQIIDIVEQIIKSPKTKGKADYASFKQTSNKYAGKPLEVLLSMKKDSNGLVFKADFINLLMRKLNLSKSQTYRVYNLEKSSFIEKRIGRLVYLKERKK